MPAVHRRDLQRRSAHSRQDVEADDGDDARARDDAHFAEQILQLVDALRSGGARAAAVSVVGNNAPQGAVGGHARACAGRAGERTCFATLVSSRASFNAAAWAW